MKYLSPLLVAIRPASTPLRHVKTPFGMRSGDGIGPITNLRDTLSIPIELIIPIQSR